MNDERRYETANLVAPGPQLPALSPTTVDPQAVIRDGLRANGEMIGGFIRSITPPAPPIDGNNVLGTYSTPTESAERTRRYKFSIIAIALICATIAGGIVLMAYNAGAVDTVSGLAGWLALTGFLCAAFVTWLQTQDLRHSAEGIAHARESYRAVVDQTDADSRRILVEAYAYAIRQDAESKAASNAARTQLTLAEMKRLAAPTATPRRPTIAAWQPASYAGAEDARPIYADEGTDPDCAQSPCSPDQSSGDQIDPLLAAVLAFVAGLYGDWTDANGLILRRLPWSLRGELSAGQRDQVLTVLERIQPPLIETRAGNRAYLNRRAYPSKFMALDAINHAWD